MPIRLSVLGASGKMGSRILRLGHSDPDFCIVGGTGRSKLHRTLGALIGDDTLQAPLDTDPASSLAECDVAIDFTHHLATLAHLDAAVRAGKPLVIGTTGHSEEERTGIVSASLKIPVLFSPNFSLGIALCLKAVATMGATLYGSSTIDIIETHHVHKKDSPSGTAWMLAHAIGNAKTATPASGSAQPRNPQEILLHAIRSGEVIGEHTVIFECGHERIELKHTAHSRDTFAHGALLAARFLIRQPPGLYSLRDLFNNDQ